MLEIRLFLVGLQGFQYESEKMYLCLQCCLSWSWSWDVWVDAPLAFHPPFPLNLQWDSAQQQIWSQHQWWNYDIGPFSVFVSVSWWASKCHVSLCRFQWFAFAAINPTVCALKMEKLWSQSCNYGIISENVSKELLCSGHRITVFCCRFSWNICLFSQASLCHNRI